MLQQQLEELKEQKHDEATAADRNPEKESMYFGGSIWVGGEICSKCKFCIFILYFLIFTSVFTYSNVIFIYVCYSDLVSFIFLIFWEKRMKTSHSTDSDSTQSNVSMRIGVICSNLWFIFVCHFVSLWYYLYCVTKCFIVWSFSVHIIWVICVWFLWYLNTFIGESF